MKRNFARAQPQFPPINWPALTVAFLAAVAECRSAPADVDLSFDPGSTIDGQVRAGAVQPDGKVLIGGDFNTLHGVLRGKVARLNADGQNDKTFLNGLRGIDGHGYVSCLTLQGDGKILIGGAFTSVNGTVLTNLARLNADGSLDTNFLSGLGGVDGEVGSLAVQSDGKILIAGPFAAVNGIAQTNLARLNPDGSLDESFNAVLADESDPNNPQPGYVRAFAVQDDGKILIAGLFTSVNGTAQTNLARLNPDGRLDHGFSADLAFSDGLGDATCLALQADHKIVVGGTFTSADGSARTNLARFNADGSLDDSFIFICPEMAGEPYQIVPRADGKLLVLGAFTLDGADWWNVALLNTNGAWDTTFTNAIPDGGAQVAALQTDGRIIVGGDFLEADGATRRSIARLQSDGPLDNSFDNGGPVGVVASVGNLAIQSDGKILIV